MNPSKRLMWLPPKPESFENADDSEIVVSESDRSDSGDSIHIDDEDSKMEN
jgi:hypothetical protein